MLQTETIVQNSDPCMKRNKVSPSLFQLLLREHVQAVAQERGTKQLSGGSLSWEDKDSELEKAKVARIHKTEPWRWYNCIEREL